uniref:Immunoglobulin domain-containing protein n=1 Tax=Ursus americanus TaxID=9643 RepID=A0A452QM93_URSAM
SWLPVLLPEELELVLLPPLHLGGQTASRRYSANEKGNQPKHLSAPMGGSVHINFSFYYCWELAKNSRVSVALRRTQFHGEFIYNSTWPSFHKDYKNRISLNLPKGQNSGSLQISNLRKEDENIYFCRVQVETREDGKKVWQARQGTKLTITHGESSCPGSHHAHPAEALKGHGALIPQAWPRPQSSCSLLLSNSSPHTHLLPSPLFVPRAVWGGRLSQEQALGDALSVGNSLKTKNRRFAFYNHLHRQF